MRVVAWAFLLLLCACSKTDDETYTAPVIEPEAQADSAYTAGQANVASSAPSLPAHNYDERDGLFYSYIGALSEDDRKAGRAAGNVVTFAYMGKRGDKHVLARVLSTGKVLGEAYCSNPCRVISYPDGSQVAFNENSLIGAAFADALAGRLQVASYEQASPPGMGVEQNPSSPGPDSETKWTDDEASMIFRWLNANDKCRGSSDPTVVSDACANRDAVYGPALAAAGICYGRQNEPASTNVMHRCGPDSIRFD